MDKWGYVIENLIDTIIGFLRNIGVGPHTLLLNSFRKKT